MRSRPPLVIDGLAGALSTAMNLAQEFQHCHAVALTDGRGVVVDFLVFAAEDHTAESAIAAGTGRVAQHPDAARAVLVSVFERVDLSCPTALDLDVWHSADRRFAGVGVELSEWLLASGQLFRSLALTVERMFS
jgi:hypothetical protein